MFDIHAGLEICSCGLPEIMAMDIPAYVFSGDENLTPDGTTAWSQTKLTAMLSGVLNKQHLMIYKIMIYTSEENRGNRLLQIKKRQSPSQILSSV